MGRIMGIDYGAKRVGIALSDAGHLIASPLMVCERDDAVAAIAKAVAEHDVESVVVGMPTSLTGHGGTAADDAEAFAREVANATGLEVHVEDERFTTVIAERALVEAGVRRRDRRQKVDGVAAALILQSYLDRR